MSIPDWPARPVPLEEQRLLPEWPLLWRGLALVGAALAMLWLALRSLRASWLLAPVSLLLAVSALLSGWGAAVHLTGGVKHDDHEFV